MKISIWRPGALFRMVLRTVICCVAFGTPTAVIFALVSGWQSWGRYWPSTGQYIANSAFVGALFSLIIGMVLGIAMAVSIVVSFRRIEDQRHFRSRMGLTPLYLMIAPLLLSPSTESYVRNFLHGPAWIKLHFMAFLTALAGAALICRAVAGKYAIEVSPLKRKHHS